MIGQYLPQTNESATVVKFKIFSHLNKAQITELTVYGPTRIQPSPTLVNPTYILHSPPIPAARRPDSSRKSPPLSPTPLYRTVLGAALTAAAHRAGGARRHRLVPLETAGRHRPPSTIEKKKENPSQRSGRKPL